MLQHIPVGYAGVIWVAALHLMCIYLRKRPGCNTTVRIRVPSTPLLTSKKLVKKKEETHLKNSIKTTAKKRPTQQKGSKDRNNNKVWDNHNQNTRARYHKKQNSKKFTRGSRETKSKTTKQRNKK
jgi:hypothetical protein